MMEAIKLRENFYWTGVTDEHLRVFDIVMETEFGSTYNAYLLKTGGKTVLFETAKAKFFDDYIRLLESLTDVHRIDYLIMSHTEPDHAGSVERLLEYSPQMKIVATGCAIGFLKEIVNREFVSFAVKDNDEMKIGDRTLRFISAPNLHWPDTMYTFIEEEQILVTCDSFGAHYCLKEIVSTAITNEDDYEKALQHYFDCIISPFKPFMRKALKRVESLDITMICTGHGPVLLGERIRDVLKKYAVWSADANPNKKKTIIMPYVSAYGYTDELAQEIAKGVRDSGDVDVRLYDMVEADVQQVKQELLYADGILFGTPTILAEALPPIWDLLSEMSSVTHGGKFAGAFGSYGWSGEGVPHITERLKQLKMKVSDGFRVRFKPSGTNLVDAYEYGYQFGCTVQKKEAVLPKKKGGSTLVKCLVCGEIFDSSVEICPVCGVGKENFVEVDVQESDYKNDTKNFYVIIGNGAAGFYAAKSIRERDRTGSIVLVSNEPYPAYNRPMLTKSIVAGLSPEQIAIEAADWYEANKIYQMLGVEVTKIDAQEQEIHLSDGGHLKYTKLIYALGSECFVPPISGSKKEQVIAIRRLADVQKVERFMETAKHAVVIGGGVLGLEAAWELKKGGLHVEVLEVAPTLMGRQLDDGSAALLAALVEKSGIGIHTGVSVEEITGDDCVTGVRLADGTVYPADIVIISAGVRPNKALAEQAGIETERGIVVDEHMRTNVENIYACGDCAQYKGIGYALWPEAVEEGKVAGANAAGDEIAYDPIFATLTFHGMNTALFAAGDNGKNPNLLYKTVEFQDMGKGQYYKYYFRNNRLCGVILIGDLSEMARLTTALEKGASYAEVMQPKA